MFRKFITAAQITDKNVSTRSIIRFLLIIFVNFDVKETI